MDLPYILKPNVARPSLPRPYVRPPSIPMPGGSSFKTSDWQKEYDKQQHRQTYMTDFNDPDEVGSIADVLRSIPKAWSQGDSALKQMGKFGSGISDYVRTWTDPFINPYLNEQGKFKVDFNMDPKAFVHNRFQDFNETVDTVDNFWKGYAMTRESEGLQERLSDDNTAERDQWLRNFMAGSNKAGMQGALEALRGKNFDFNTQKGFWGNLAREIASPTAIATLGLSAAAKGLGKVAAKGATEVGEQLSKRATRKILKNFSGDIGDAVTKARGDKLFKKAFSTRDEVALSIAKDLNKELFESNVRTMRILTATNKAKGIVDAVDSFGPMLAVKTNVAPVWKLLMTPVKVGSAGINKMVKGLDSAAQTGAFKGEDINFVSYNMNGGAQAEEELFKTYADVMREVDSDFPLDLSRNTSLAMKDIDGLHKVLKQSYDVAGDKAFIDAISRDTNAVDVNKASMFLQQKSQQSLMNNLNNFAKTSSGGILNNFKEYSDLVSKVYGAEGVKNEALTELYGMVQKLRVTTIRNDESIKGILDMSSALKKTVDMATDFNKLRDQEIAVYTGRVEEWLAKLNDREELLSKLSAKELDIDFILDTSRASGGTTNVTVSRLAQEAKSMEIRLDAMRKNDELQELLFDRRETLELIRREQIKPKPDSKAVAYMQKQLDELNATALVKQFDELVDASKVARNGLRSHINTNWIPQIKKVINGLKTRTTDDGTFDYIVNQFNKQDVTASITGASDLESARRVVENAVDSSEYTKHKQRSVSEASIAYLEGMLTNITKVDDSVPAYVLKVRKEIEATIQRGINTLKSGDPDALNVQLYIDALTNHIKKLAANLTEYAPANDAINNIFKRFLKADEGKTNIIDAVQGIKGKGIELTVEDMITENIDNLMKNSSDSVKVMKSEITEIRDTLGSLDNLMAQIDDLGIPTTFLDELTDTLEIAARITESLDTATPAEMAKMYRELLVQLHADKDTITSTYNLLTRHVESDVIDAGRRRGNLIAETRRGQTRDAVVGRLEAIYKDGREYAEEALKKSPELDAKVLYDDYVAKHIAELPETYKSVDPGALDVTERSVLDAIETLKSVDDKLTDAINKYAPDRKEQLTAIGSAANVKKYVFTTSHLLDWFTLYSGKAIKKMIDNVAFDKHDDAFMEALRGVAAIGSKELREIQTLIVGNKGTADLAGDALRDIETRINKVPVLKSIKDNIGINEFVLKFEDMQALKDNASRVYNDLSAMGSFRTFLGRMNNSAIPQDLQDKLLDSMNSFYKSLDSQLLPKYDEYTKGTTTTRDILKLQQKSIGKIIDQVDTLLGQSTKHNFKLENAVEAMLGENATGDMDEALIAQYNSMFSDVGRAKHTAVADSVASVMLRKHFMKEKIDPSVSKIVATDWETDGLNKSFSNAHQAALYDDSSGQATLFVRVFDRPNVLEDDTLLHKLYSNAGDEARTTTAELRNVYNRIHHEGDMDYMAEWFGFNKDKINIVAANSDRELYDLYAAKLKELKPDAGRMVLDMYNGTQFDVDIINRGYEVPLVDKAKIQDSLIDMREKYGVRKLAVPERVQLEEMLKEYIGIRRVEHLSDVTRLGSDDTYGVVEYAANTVRRDLIPSLDGDFRTSMNSVINAFTPKQEEVSLMGDILDSASVAQGADSMDMVRAFKEEMTDAFDTLKGTKKSLRNYTMSSEDVPKMFDDADVYYQDIHEAMRSDKNIMAQLLRVAEDHGLNIPLLTVKKVLNTDTIYKNFNVADEASLYKDTVKNMTKIGEKIDSLATNVRDMKYFAEDDTVFAVKRLLQDYINNNMFSHVYAEPMRLLKDTKDPIMAYAQSQQMFTMLKQSGDTGMMSKIRAEIEDIAPVVTKNKYDVNVNAYTNILDNPYLVKRFPDIEYKHTFFEPSVNEQTERMYNYTKKRLEYDMFNLQDYVGKMEEEGFTAPTQRMFSVYEPMLESLAIMEKTLASISDETIKATFYDSARASFEAFHAYHAFDKLKSFMDLPPEDMASYLWNWAKTRVVIDVNDLNSKSFFRSHTKGDKLDLINEDMTNKFTELLQNKKELADQGIIMTRKGNKVAFELDATMVDHYQKLPVYKIDDDLDLTDQIENLLKPSLSLEGDEISTEHINALRKSMMKLIESRKKLIHLTPSGASSTLEKLDAPAWVHAQGNLGEFSSKAFKVEELVDLNRFDGMPFNHSYLGSIDNIRQALNFASYNPVKTIYNASQTMHEALDTKTQYLNLVFSDSAKLSTMTDDIMTDQEVFEFFKTNKHMTLGFIGTLGKGDPKVRRFILNSAKDVAKAKEFGAVVLDQHTYTKTVQTINHNKMPAPIRTLNRWVLTPWKLGTMAYNPGTILRNLGDTSIKNVVSAEGDPEIAKYMAASAVHYAKYKSIGKMVVDIMNKQNINIDAATDIAFSKLGPMKNMDRAIYDDITFFKQNGPSSGMVRALQEHYGDSFKKVYKSMNAKKMGISPGEFKAFVSNPDMGSAKGWTETMFPEYPIYQDRLMQSRMDFQLHKKAYAMLEGYKGHELTVNSVVEAMKNPVSKTYWSDDALKFYADNIKRVDKISFKDDLISKVMNTAVVDNALTLNADVEEMLRISLYRYLRDQGSDVSEALSEVTRTHFDYDNKSLSEMYSELIIPFSTFRRNSLVYWMTEMGRQPHLAQALGDYQNAQMDREDLTLDDVTMSRAMSYHLTIAGNIINNKKGTAVKTMPSIYDALGFIWNPAGYVAEGIHPILTQAADQMNIEQYSNESDEDFKLRRTRLFVGVLPFLGAIISRAIKPGHSVAYNLSAGTIMSDLKTPGTKAARDAARPKSATGHYVGGYPEAPVGMSQWQEGPVRKVKIAPSSDHYKPNYNNLDKQMKKSMAKFRRTGVHLSKTASRPTMKGWNRLMTRSGKPRQSLRRLPKTRWTLSMRMYLVNYRVTKEFRP